MFFSRTVLSKCLKIINSCWIIPPHTKNVVLNLFLLYSTLFAINNNYIRYNNKSINKALFWKFEHCVKSFLHEVTLNELPQLNKQQQTAPITNKYSPNSDKINVINASHYLQRPCILACYSGLWDFKRN